MRQETAAAGKNIYMANENRISAPGQWDSLHGIRADTGERGSADRKGVCIMRRKLQCLLLVCLMAACSLTCWSPAFAATRTIQLDDSATWELDTKYSPTGARMYVSSEDGTVIRYQVISGTKTFNELKQIAEDEGYTSDGAFRESKTGVYIYYAYRIGEYLDFQGTVAVFNSLKNCIAIFVERHEVIGWNTIKVSAKAQPTPAPNPRNGTVINAANFPDKVFREYVTKLEQKSFNGDGALSSSEIQDIRKITVHGASSLTGIEYFTALQALDCSNGSLTQLNLSKNTKLKELNCANNRLTQLDLSKNAKLAKLDCSNNYLTKLDLRNNTKLQKLNCRSLYLQEVYLKRDATLGSIQKYDVTKIIYGNAGSSTKIKLNKSKATLQLGKSIRLKVKGSTSGLRLTWYSSKTGIARVSSNGTVTAVGRGTCYITCTDEKSGASATCKITVK